LPPCITGKGRRDRHPWWGGFPKHVHFFLGETTDKINKVRNLLLWCLALWARGRFKPGSFGTATVAPGGRQGGRQRRPSLCHSTGDARLGQRFGLRFFLSLSPSTRERGQGSSGVTADWCRQARRVPCVLYGTLAFSPQPDHDGSLTSAPPLAKRRPMVPDPVPSSPPGVTPGARSAQINRRVPGAVPEAATEGVAAAQRRAWPRQVPRAPWMLMLEGLFSKPAGVAMKAAESAPPRPTARQVSVLVRRPLPVGPCGPKRDGAFSRRAEVVTAVPSGSARANKMALHCARSTALAWRPAGASVQPAWQTPALAVEAQRKGCRSTCGRT
jgi:hypothetical protein